MKTYLQILLFFHLPPKIINFKQNKRIFGSVQEIGVPFTLPTESLTVGVKIFLLLYVFVFVSGTTSLFTCIKSTCRCEDTAIRFESEN